MVTSQQVDGVAQQRKTDNVFNVSIQVGGVQVGDELGASVQLTPGPFSKLRGWKEKEEAWRHLAKNDPTNESEKKPMQPPL